MRQAHTESWQIRFDFPSTLQFSGYVGQQEGFSLTDSTLSSSQAETEWRTWWNILETSTSEVRTQYDPPDFNSLKGTPALQQLCRRYWRAFHQMWGTSGGKKTPTVSKMQSQLQQIRPDYIVRMCMRAAGKSDVQPFILQLDFVIWPDDYQRIISKHHIVLGARYIEPSHTDALRAIIQKQVAELV